MRRGQYFSGNYGSALGSYDTAAKLIAQAGATQGQMYANLGKQISSTLEKFRLNKEKKEKQQRAENQFVNLYEGNAENPIFKALNINSTEEAKAVAKDISKDPQLIQQAMNFAQFATTQQQAQEASQLNALQSRNIRQQMGDRRRTQQGNQQLAQFNLNTPKGETPDQFRQRAIQAQGAGNMNPQAMIGASNQFLASRGAQAKAESDRLAKEEKFGRDVALEAVKAGLKNPPQVPQEKAYQPGPDIMADNINRAYKIMDTDGFIPATGFGGLLKAVPGTDAHKLGNLLQTIKGNIGFDYLQQMRQNSPTGGALGQVSNQELSTLQSVFGSLEQTQGEEDLKYNLQLLNHVYNNIIHGVGNHDVPHPDQSTPSNQGPQSMQSLLDEEARLKELVYQREGIFNTPQAQVIDAK